MPLARLARIAQPAAAALAFYAVLWLALRNNRPPLGIFLYGGVVGLLYALVAFGLILIYRANRVINFANAEIGAAAAALGLLLIKSRWEVPYVAALLITLSTAVVAGMVVEYLVVRRFSKAPRLILSVATIGVGLVFAGIQLALPYFVTGNIVDSDTDIINRPLWVLGALGALGGVVSLVGGLWALQNLLPPQPGARVRDEPGFHRSRRRNRHAAVGRERR